MNTRIRSAIAGALIAGTMLGAPAIAAAEPVAPVAPIGLADDDMHELDWQIMQSWLAQKLGAGFQRFLNGDGGGSGYENDTLGTGSAMINPVDSCPVCNFGDFGADDNGAAQLAEHLFAEHFAEWLRTQQVLLSTGSAGR